MKTAGDILKAARLRSEISLVQAAKATKIQLRFLRALEENDFKKLPSLTSARGFLKNYAEFLQLAPAPILAIFRRDFFQPKKNISPPNLVERRLGKVCWSPRLTMISFLLLFFLALSGFLGYQYFSLRTKPSLTVFSPTDGQRVIGGWVEVTGRVGKGALVSVNGHPVLLSKGGRFRYQLELFSGKNIVIVEAKTKLGKKTSQRRIVFSD